MTLKIEMLQNFIAGKYPVYVGFVPAADLASYAEAPAFKTTDDHNVLASEALSSPATKWQRPLNAKNVEKIRRTFNKSDNFMPNPVLLAAKASLVASTQLPSAAGGKSSLWQLVASLGTNSEKPFFIIDGQHRIMGLAKSAQSGSPIPVVLLLAPSNNQNVYKDRDFAHQFAQVTTQATPLGKIHNEWLSFAFELGKYSTKSSKKALFKAKSRKKAMSVTATLTSSQQIAKQNNPFHNAIIFNDSRKLACSALFGKPFDAIEFVELLKQHIFDRNPAAVEMHVCEQLTFAASALIAVCKQTPVPADHVFFGKTGCHRIMAEAFLVAVCRKIADGTAPQDQGAWETALQNLKFDATDWDFSNLPVAGKKWPDHSKRLAVSVFLESFVGFKVPSGTHGLHDIRARLRGDGYEFRVSQYSTDPALGVAPLVFQSVVQGSGRLPIKLDSQTKYIAIEPQTENVVGPRVSLIDVKTLDLVSVRNGVAEIPAAAAYKLKVSILHYGGAETLHEFDVK